MSTEIFYVINYNNSKEDVRNKLFSHGFQTFFGFPYSEADISISSTGKPEFYNLSHPGCFFNLSHSKSILALACSTSPIGIDVEDQRLFSHKLVQRISSEEEFRKYEQSSDKQAYALALWTFKEAYVKYTGEGLRKQFDQMYIPIIQDHNLEENPLALKRLDHNLETLFFFSVPIMHSRITICSQDSSHPTIHTLHF